MPFGPTTVGSGISAGLGLWKMADSLIERARVAKKAQLEGLIDYINAAQLYVTALAVEAEQIVSQAVSITPDSDNNTMQALAERTNNYLISNERRQGLERALRGIEEYFSYLAERNETVSTWPLGDAAQRADILRDIENLLKQLKDFLRILAFGGPLDPFSGLPFIQRLVQPIQDRDRVLTREKALEALTDPTYITWRNYLADCERIVSNLRLRFR
jgi:hypothetical protein